MTIGVGHFKDAWIVLPDVVMAIVRDQEIAFYPPVHVAAETGNTQAAYYNGVNPYNGLTEQYQLHHASKTWRKFTDQSPTTFADRDALDNPANWGTIGGRTVTAVTRISTPFDQRYADLGRPGGNDATFEHKCYLQLSGNLAEGGPYTISCTGAGFTAGTFTYNYNTTRAECIHNTQVGHKPNDSFKVATVAQWITGWGTEGRVQIPTVLGSATFDIINQSDDVVFTGSLVEMVSPTDLPANFAVSYAAIISSVNTTTDIFTISDSRPTASGARFIASNIKATLPTGLTNGTVYYAHSVGAVISSANSGTDVITVDGIPSASGGDSPYLEVIAEELYGTLPGGLTAGTTYYVRALSGVALTLHPTRADAAANTNIINITGTGTGNLSCYSSKVTLHTNPTDAITGANRVDITVSTAGSTLGRLYEYPSTTQTPIVLTGITSADPAVFTSVGHGLTVGDLLFPQRINGMNSIEGRVFRVYKVLGADTFTCQWINNNEAWEIFNAANTSVHPAFGGSTYVTPKNLMLKGHYSHQAATWVYSANYSALTTPGIYRLRIPGLGVGDPFTINAGVYHTALKTMMKGVYNECSGMALSAAIGGIDRPTMYQEGASIYHDCYESLMPGCINGEVGLQNGIAAALTGLPSTWGRAPITMGTIPKATGWFGGIRDAGDSDFSISRHAEYIYFALEFGWRQLPSGSTKRDTKSGFPNLSTLFGATYAGTDALGDTIAMALQYIEPMRVTQKVDGRVYSGLCPTTPTGDDYLGGNGDHPTNPTWTNDRNAYLLAADPASNFCYAAAAAKAAHAFYDAGFATLGDMWLSSAELAYDWADDMLADMIANGASAVKTITGATAANPVVIASVAHGYSNGDEVLLETLGGMTQVNRRKFIVANKTNDTFELTGENGTGHTTYTSGGTSTKVTLVIDYFIYNLNLKVNASWSQSQFSTLITAIVAQVPSRFKLFAAGCLYSCTDSTTYRTVLDASYPLGQSTPWMYHAAWEYCQGDDGSGTASDHRTFYNTTQGWSADTNFNHNESLTGAGVMRTNVAVLRCSSDAQLITGGPRHWLYRTIIKTASADPQASEHYKLLQTGVNYQYGVNQNNLCCTIGLGASKDRNPVVLIRDREASGRKNWEWPGVTVFTWFEKNDLTPSSFYNGIPYDSPNAYTQFASAGVYPHKVITPHIRAIPAAQNHFKNTNIIYQAELGLSQVIGGYLDVLWLHCYDGNGATEYAVGTKRLRGVSRLAA